jgi:predicted transcriptional regulator
MGAAGKALKQVLKTYEISQNKLALILGKQPFVVFRWYHEQTDPSGETITDIAKALQQIEPAAAKEFVRLYLGEFMEDEDY